MKFARRLQKYFCLCESLNTNNLITVIKQNEGKA